MFQQCKKKSEQQIVRANIPELFERLTMVFPESLSRLLNDATKLHGPP